MYAIPRAFDNCGKLHGERAELCHASMHLLAAVSLYLFFFAVCAVVWQCRLTILGGVVSLLQNLFPFRHVIDRVEQK